MRDSPEPEGFSSDLQSLLKQTSKCYIFQGKKIQLPAHIEKIRLYGCLIFHSDCERVNQVSHFLSHSASSFLISNQQLSTDHFINLLSLWTFPSSAPPSLAMGLCWTSTSVSAGEDSTIRAEWRSTASKVGYKSLCDVKIYFTASCRMKTLSLLKLQSFLNLRKTTTFQLAATHFVWYSSVSNEFPGVVRLWKLL